MAKFVKSTREVLDVDDEIKKLKDKDTKNSKSDKKKKDTKKDTVKKSKTVKTKEKKGIFHFFKGVKKEMSLVKWPSRKDMVKYSVATVAFVLFFSLYFYVIQLIVALVKMWV